MPALASVGLLGWGVGLAALVLWRWLVLAASAGALHRHAPRPAADHLLLGPHIDLTEGNMSTPLAIAYETF